MSVTQWRNENAGQKVATERIFRIPLYTRPKELVTNTGFTGNNPYIAYPRKMTVQFKATLRGNADEEFRDYTFNLEIIQVQVSRAKTVGGYHLMQGENPIYICSFDFTGEVS